MSARWLFALLSALALSIGAASLSPSAVAEQSQSPLGDQGSSPNYRSTVTSVSPATPGLHLQVLQFSDRLLARNETGKTIEVKGYEGEPYARMRPGGAVEVNARSPAYFLNQSFYGNVTVPRSASASAPPHWQLVDRTGQFEWHDHRIHWMSPALPPQVKDKGKRTLIFAWRVPIAVGGRSGEVAGTLYWTPNDSSAPVALYVLGGAIVLLGALLVIFTRRRRRPGGAASAGSASQAGEPVGEGGGEGADAKAESREAW